MHMDDIEIITDDTALGNFCARLKGSDFLAIDTEFIRERTYFPRLCLIQIATEDHIACIDPLTIRDLAPLAEFFFDDGIVKVFHAGDQDMEIFYHLFGKTPAPVFDTQIAATVLGHGESIGYAALVQKELNIELDKSHSRTDWCRRPLSEAQLRYASDDVRYLVMLYRDQQQRLAESGRSDWLQADFDALADAGRYRPDPESAWRRVKGHGKLKPKQLAVLQNLTEWREQQAITEDKPRRRILGDEILLDLARFQPRDLDKLGEIRGLHGGQRKDYGKALLAVIAAGLARDRDSWPQIHKKSPLSAADDALADSLAAITRLCAQEAGIAAGSLASRRELEDLVRGERDLQVLTGWRRRYLGERLLGFLEGRYAIRVENGTLTINGEN